MQGRAVRHHVLRASEGVYVVPEGFGGHCRSFRRRTCVDDEAGSVHLGFYIVELGAGGSVDWHVHSYEETVYIVEGEVVLETEAGAFVLREGDYGVLSVGAAHSWRNTGDQPVRWADMCAPQPRPADTLFVAPRPSGRPSIVLDPRDPRTRTFGHVDVDHLDPSKQTSDLLAESASARTGLIVDGGVSSKPMIDRDLGAHLQTMLMVQCEPGGGAATHDHPLEEAYLIVEGSVDAVLDGTSFRLNAGDFAWAGVGCVHALSNPGAVSARWLQTQAPHPPDRYAYRFQRDWDDLRATVDNDRQ